MKEDGKKAGFLQKKCEEFEEKQKRVHQCEGVKEAEKGGERTHGEERSQMSRRDYMFLRSVNTKQKMRHKWDVQSYLH